MPTELAAMLTVSNMSIPQVTSDDSLRSFPQVFAFPGWITEPITNGVEPMTPEATPAHPVRVFTLPNPTVFGYAEEAASAGRTVDMGFSTHVRAQYAAQGHYDAIPTWNVEQAEGNGTQNVHGRYLRQGLLTQLTGYQPAGPESAISYIAALSRNKNESGILGAVT